MRLASLRLSCIADCSNRLYWLLAISVLATSALTAADTVTLEPLRDATLYEHSEGALANGAGEFLFIGRSGQPEKRRLLLAFDVAGSVPQGASITAVSLFLHMSRTISGPRASNLHLLVKQWGEGASDAIGNQGNEGTGISSAAGDATWIHSSFPDETWESVGGDFTSPARASLNIDQEGTYEWSSSAMVQDVEGWLQDPSSNHGWILLGDETASRTAKRFDSRENPVSENRPRLSITFEIPDVAVPVLPGDFDNSGRVDFDDFFAFVPHFGSVETDVIWDPVYDMVVNGMVNIDDFFAFASNFGRSNDN